MSRKLPWSDDEIVRSYRGAKDRDAQIGILADLNDTTVGNIRRIIDRALGVNTTARETDEGGFGYRCSVALEHDGVRYTIKEVARLNGVTINAVGKKCRVGKGVCVVRGIRYQVIHRRG